jgi:hypothetical protein
MPTLVLTPRYTEDAQALWRAAGRLGWDVQRLTTWHIPEDLRSVPDPVLYLESRFWPDAGTAIWSSAFGASNRLATPTTGGVW